LSNLRIPVSLKLDTETEFYNDFFLDMRENHTLSSFIVNILTAYYENDDIRIIVDKHLDLLSPFAPILQQLDRINNEHTKAMMVTSMASHSLKNVHSKLSEEVNSEGLSLLEKEELDPELSGRVEKIEKALPDIADKLNTLLLAIQSGGFSQNQGTLPISQPTVSISLEEAPKVLNNEQMLQLPTIPNVTPQVIELPTINSSENNQPSLTDTIIQSSPNTVSVEIQSESAEKVSTVPTVISTEQVAESVAEPVRVKPASFGKAAKSIRKED
jgi:hypothetical protein